MNPWVDRGGDLCFEPDLAPLGMLLAVPVHLRAGTQSGKPALALDVWVAHELRGLRAGRGVAPASAPCVLPREVGALLASLPKAQRADLSSRLARGVKGAAGAEAMLPGKNYVKQVDVVMSAWDTEPQLMVSTKRTDSALGKNAGNRVEESYGDAKNLRSRYPRAALGFVYSLRAAPLDQERDKAEWLIDLLGKLGQEDDAYDAVALVLPEIGHTPGGADGDPTDRLADAGLLALAPDGGEPEELPGADVDEVVAMLSPVRLPAVGVPSALAPGRFLQVMAERVLDGSPVNYHRKARDLRRAAALTGR